MPSLGAVALHCLVSMTEFACITQYGDGCLWWFNYPSPLPSTEFRVALFARGEMPLPLFSFQRFGLPSRATSVAQLVENLHAMQYAVGARPA